MYFFQYDQPVNTSTDNWPPSHGLWQSHIRRKNNIAFLGLESMNHWEEAYAGQELATVSCEALQTNMNKSWKAMTFEQI